MKKASLQQQRQDEELQEIKQKEQEQGQGQYIQVIQKKFKTLPDRIERYKNIGTISKFQQILIEKITQQTNTLNRYQNNVKIYIVFMGTLSAGKSTFINALLGQQLLPSKNQSCTSQVTFIGHQNTYDNENTKITINKQEFNSLKEASAKLTKMQKDPMGKVNIKTQSYFHSTLNKDLQDKVIFIDTPGIELNKATPKQFLAHFGKINQLIQLDEYSIRINLWILNYPTFDSDKELQKNMNFMTNNEDEQIKKQNIGNQQQQQKIPKTLKRPSSEFFYILNKYEQKSKDDSKETVFQNINKSFKSENIFMISSQKALQYNIMTYGTNEAQCDLIQTYYEDNSFLFKQGEAEAKDFCNTHFKNNQKLFQNQDFNKFTNQISLEIQKQLDNLFQYKLEQLEQVTQFLEQSKKQMNRKEQHFRCIKDKMILLKEQAEQHKNIEKISQFELQVEEEIRQEINSIEKCQNNSKIYIVFMGTLSSGKSTFINSLIGQKLLPSHPTSQVTYIELLNTNANPNTKIKINDKEFDSLEYGYATYKLTEIQKKPQMGTVNIQTQSHFHSTFVRKDLQERVVFIDTPGIDLTDSEQYLPHISEINKLIKVDECSIRINLWILNFDSEVKEIQENLFRIKKEVEYFGKKDFSKQQQDSFFYIINKFDISRISENKFKQATLKDLKNQFNTDNIFKISASDALMYNVMNYGTKDNQDKFLQIFLKNNQQEYKSIDDAKEYCKNPYLIEYQDFNKFTCQISLEIQNQTHNLFDQRLSRFNKVIAQIDKKTQSLKVLIDQYTKLKNEITMLQKNFGNFYSYIHEIQKNNQSFFQSVNGLIDLAISQIDQNEKQPVIERTCLNIILKIEEQTQYFLDITIQFIEKLKDQLKFKSYFDPEQNSKYNLECQNNIQFFLEYEVSFKKDQFVKSQVSYVYDSMKIRSYQTFWERFWKWFGYDSRLSREISGSITQCAFIAHYYVEDNSNESIDKAKLRDQMIEWKRRLKSKIELFVDDYCEGYTEVLECIKQAMNGILN